MSIKVAINGFGRIGRLAFRQLFEMANVDVVAIYDLTSSTMLAHLLKYDTSQGTYKEAVVATDDAITVRDKRIPVLSEKNPENLPWASLGVDIALECTGFFATKEKSTAHLRAGAKRVLISTSAGKDLPTIVFGVNEATLKASDTIVSAASCTTNCLAPMAFYLNRLSSIEKGFMTTIHAYTNDQNTLDGPHAKGDLRRARTAAANIIPTTTGAAKAIGLVIQELDGKLDGTSQRVPVIAGSLTELVAAVKDVVTVAQLRPVVVGPFPCSIHLEENAHGFRTYMRAYHLANGGNNDLTQCVHLFQHRLNGVCRFGISAVFDHQQAI